VLGDGVAGAGQYRLGVPETVLKKRRVEPRIIMLLYHRFRTARRIFMKTISITTQSYNEEANVEEAYRRVRNAMADMGRYRYEHIFIDNASEEW
jgi:hypothetical protein